MAKTYPKPTKTMKGLMYIDNGRNPSVAVSTTFGFFASTAQNLADAGYVKAKSRTGGDDGPDTKGALYYYEHVIVDGKYNKPSLGFMYCVKSDAHDDSYSVINPATTKIVRNDIDRFYIIVSMTEFKKLFYAAYPRKKE